MVAVCNNNKVYYVLLMKIIPLFFNGGWNVGYCDISVMGWILSLHSHFLLILVTFLDSESKFQCADLP